MSAIKLTYIGGGATRAPGTVLALTQRADQFAGSEIVLMDRDAEAVELVRQVGQRFIDAAGADLTLTATTDRRAALTDADAVLTSFRPGGFEMRRLDERIPLKYSIIGQETQGPGGFFMALRALHVFRDIAAEMTQHCPDAWLINYTNPINIVSDALTRYTDLKVISLCEGPITFPRETVAACGLDPDRLDATMIGLNHAIWSTRHLYDGEDVMPLIEAAYADVMASATISRSLKRRVELAVTLGRLPAHYFQYYYYHDEILAEMQSAEKTRAEYLMANVPRYKAHYRAVAASPTAMLDPAQSRDGIMEFDLSLAVLNAIINDTGEVFGCNVPNKGAIDGLADDLVVEVPCVVNRHGATPLVSGSLPAEVAGLVQMLGQYQRAAADAGWRGDRRAAIRALLSNPLVLDLQKATRLYDEMAAAQRAFLPARLL